MRALVVSLALASSGCFQSIAPDRPDGGGGGDGGPAGPFTTSVLPDGSFRTLIDSTSDSAWTYGDFESQLAVTAVEPWDLRFQRFHISTNGGTSGAGGVEVVAVADVEFADVRSEPADGWISDSTEDFAFDQGDGWYDYDMMTHVLRPKPLVWIVRTNGGSPIKLEITTYYDEAGTAGWFSLHWSSL